MKPLFMWAGGKTRLLKKYKERDIMPESFDTYIEPFVGAGAMFVWAYEQNPDARFILNDYNPCIMNIYKAIRDDHDVFVERINELSAQYLPLEKAARKEFYYNLRADHAFDYEKWNQTEEAATLYFLMKTGFNGIWQINKNTNNRFGTPSGLLNQKDKVYDKDNVHEWHLALQHCKLMTGDFGETIGEVKENSFVFLDPPYRGSFTQYGVDFDDEMQNRVIKFLNDLTSAGAYAMMSNRDVGDGFFESRQGTNRLVYFDVTYTAGRRKKNADGTHSAKKAREILMIGEQNGKKS
jgi:DNA adenine methylase